jgi:hypothetical protein
MAKSKQSAALLQATIAFEKAKASLRYYMLGKGYNRALQALGEAERHHIGVRKDKYTPELHHQVRICFTLISLKNLINEEDALIVALLHDIQEDYDVESEYIQQQYGNKIATAVWLTTKKFKGTVKDKAAYLHAISMNELASLVKGADRVDNLQFMIGVFNTDKIEAYSKEAELEFIPMLRNAVRYFPQQMFAYGMLRATMKRQLGLLKEYVAVARRADSETAANAANYRSMVEYKAEALKYSSKLQDVTVELKQVTDKRNQEAEVLNKLVHQQARLDFDICSSVIQQAIDAPGLNTADIAVLRTARSLILKHLEKDNPLAKISAFDGIKPQDTAKDNTTKPL